MKSLYEAYDDVETYKILEAAKQAEADVMSVEQEWCTLEVKMQTLQSQQCVFEKKNSTWSLKSNALTRIMYLKNSGNLELSRNKLEQSVVKNRKRKEI